MLKEDKLENMNLYIVKMERIDFLGGDKANYFFLMQCMAFSTFNVVPPPSLSGSRTL